MWLLGYRFHCVLMLIISVLTVLAMMYGDAYADAYLGFWNDRSGLFDRKAFSAMRWSHLLSPVMVIYLYPIVSTCIAYRLPRTRLLFIAVALLLLGWELAAIGGGGDRKGCEECGLSALFYGVLFPLLYPLIMGIALTVQFFRARRLPPEPQRTPDKALAAAAGVFCVLMLGAPFGFYWW